MGLAVAPSFVRAQDCCWVTGPPPQSIDRLHINTVSQITILDRRWLDALPDIAPAPTRHRHPLLSRILAIVRQTFSPCLPTRALTIRATNRVASRSYVATYIASNIGANVPYRYCNPNSRFLLTLLNVPKKSVT